MTGRRRGCRITVETSRFSGILSGPVRAIHPAIKRLDCPWQYDPRAHAYKIPLQRLDDVLARLELDGHVVDVQMSGWSA